MNWSDISKMVGKAAPLVGAALGGPAGSAVGSMVASALGVDDTPNAIAGAIKNDPDAFVKIKKFEMENDQSIRDHVFKTLSIELKDKQGARGAHKDSAMPGAICIILTLLVAAGAYFLFTEIIPADNKGIAHLLFGTVLAKWGDTIAYWVGTTRSSAEKNKIIGGGR